MDNIVDSLSNAYQDLISAAASAFEAKESTGGQKTPATDAALENFKQRWELFRVACDQAEEFVESVKQRIGSECLVDEATGSVTSTPGQPVQSGLPPISAVRLEQMSKAVRWLVIELQQGSGAGGASSHPNSTAPFDARLRNWLMGASSIENRNFGFRGQNAQGLQLDLFEWQSWASFNMAHYASDCEHLVLSAGSSECTRERSYLQWIVEEYLAVVIDSEEALQTLKVLDLLRWLEAIGLKNETATSEPLLEPKYMNLEVVSFSDGKHAVAKAANFLLEKQYLGANTEKPNLTESDITDALRATGK
ncbi:hypothetical protein ACJIZ3_015415 [Penstemon smallii]|uniref:Uncharacterized protein n=1 Tax=Penstemon smallii TaxID=265156 RepID=A0ABD3RPQ3_9LAMI